MHGIDRLIDGLARGDAVAMYVLIFTIVATVAIVAVTKTTQGRRRR